MKTIARILVAAALALLPAAPALAQANGAPMVPNSSGSGGGGGSPTGPAGGDLAGSYPNPTVANLSNVTNASLPNAGLANSSITFGSTSVALGSTITNLNAVNIGPTTPGTGAFTTLSATGAALFSNTTAPTLSAGALAIGGTLGTPNNPSGNGEGQIYLSATQGVVIQGQGSSFSLQLLASGGANNCTMNQAGTFACSSNVTAGSSLIANGASQIAWTGRGILTSPAGGSIQSGAADAASPVAQTLRAQSVVAGTSNTSGQNWTVVGSLGTGTGAPGAINFQTGSSGNGTGSTVNAAGTVFTLGPSTVNGSDASTTFAHSVTWNTTGQPTAFSLTVTNTASNGSSLLMNLLAGVSGTTSEFKVDIGGNGTFNGTMVSSGINETGSSTIAWSGRGSLTSPAAATIQLGNADAASPVAQTVTFQNVVAGTSNTNGVNTTIIGSRSTGTGTSGDIIFQTGGTGAGTTVQNSAVTALTIKGATQNVLIGSSNQITLSGTGTSIQIASSTGTLSVGGTTFTIGGGSSTVAIANQMTMVNIGSDATHTDSTVCQDTTTHQFYSGSGAAGICLGTSSIRFKHDIAPLDAGLPQIMALQPIRYRLNADHGDPNKPLYGFTAEQGGIVLPDLMGRDAQGRPNTFDYLGVVPVLVRAIQEQQAEIAALRNQLHHRH